MNDIIDDFYLKYMECLNTKDRDICDKYYLPAVLDTRRAIDIPTPIKPKTPVEQQGYKQAWRFVNRGNFIRK